MVSPKRFQRMPEIGAGSPAAEWAVFVNGRHERNILAAGTAHQVKLAAVLVLDLPADADVSVEKANVFEEMCR